MPAHYEDLDQMKNVKVKIPKEGTYMEFVRSNEFKTGDGKNVFVDNHWRSSSCINGQIVQRNFFGITREQLGKNIAGSVEIQVKTTLPLGKKILLINIWPDTKKQSPAKYKMAFEKDETGKLQLCFYEISQPKKSAA